MRGMSKIHAYVAAAACLFVVTPGSVQAQPTRKSVRAANIDDGSIRLDGRLDEEVWLTVPAIADFTQKEPVEGAAPTDEMEVRFVYDSSALYIGARMYTRNSPEVQAPLGRRDDSDQAENIQVWLDTFLDRRSAAMFGVTAAGVRLDQFLSADEEENGDVGYAPVWEARTSIGADSWTAELWIPFSQLRFSRENELTWGVNVRRFRPTLEEQDYWVLVPRTERVFISRFGNLDGIAGIRPSRRIELLPYVAGASTFNGNRAAGNPFDDGSSMTSRAGLDMKLGLGPNLTLEATFNPDFGQVEADAAEVNLTAFETRFPERRPFFTENASLFSISHPNFYYSRRIGARPRGPASADFVDYPADSTIVAAAKLTGRLPSRTSVAALSAVTGSETARLSNIGVPDITRVNVAPTTVYAVGRVRQEFGALGSSYGFFVNSMHRDLSAGDPLASLLTRNALAVAGDTLLRFKDGEYQFRGAVGGSHINGEAAAIERVQLSSAHFAQRPDRPYNRLDPTLTSLSDWAFQAAFDRVSGEHWLFGASTKLDSVNFETNDFASLNGADGLRLDSNIKYRETRPNRILRNYTIAFNQSNDSTTRLKRQTGSLRPNVTVTWANFWTSTISVARDLSTEEVSLTRGGPLMRGPAGWTTQLNIGNQTTSNTRWSGEAIITTDEAGGNRERYSVTLSTRPAPRWQLSAEPYYETQIETQQYVGTVGGGRPETYGNRYVFAFVDRTTLATAMRASFTFKPDLTLDVYAEPFAASGRYYDFGELLLPGEQERLTYGHAPGTSITTLADGRRSVNAGAQSFTLNTTDFNTLSFRSNVVLRWEWRPGSTFYLVWQQDRSETEVLGSSVGVGDMFSSATRPGQNF
ncbi:MAG: DUF5916 domain-containing protein, partial [Vicinamibacterales bacterium]